MFKSRIGSKKVWKEKHRAYKKNRSNRNPSQLRHQELTFKTQKWCWHAGRYSWYMKETRPSASSLMQFQRHIKTQVGLSDSKPAYGALLFSFSRLILGPSLPVNPFFSQPNSVLNSISWKTLLVPKLSYPNGIWRHLKEHHLFHLTKGANHVIRSHPLHLSFLSRGFGNLGNLNRSNGSYRPPQTSLKCSLPFSRVI